jgi:hypothetical protein
MAHPRNRARKTHVAIPHDVVRILVFPALLHDVVRVFRDLLTVPPGDEAVAVLCDECVLHLPPLKIDGDPGALALGPARAHALEGETDGEQGAVGAF